MHCRTPGPDTARQAAGQPSNMYISKTECSVELHVQIQLDKQLANLVIFILVRQGMQCRTPCPDSARQAAGQPSNI